MSFRKRLLILFIVLLLLTGLDALLAPVVMANGVRFWLRWAARQEGLGAELGKVEAPFLRAVTIRNLRLISPSGAAREVSLEAKTITVDLNLRGWIFSRHASLLRSIEIDQFAGRVRAARRGGAITKLDWRQLSRLVPTNFRIGSGDLEITTPTTTISFRGVSLTASAIESGKFFAQRLFVSSPILRQTFLNLRGATSWESERLTIAGIPLVRGLDLEAVTLDLAHLERRRLGVDLHLDAYGGSLRASFQGRAGEKFALDIAGSAANISLAQISTAMGFLEPLSGSVHASKFTFRGNPGEFLDATASIWMEVTGFAWRARRADNIMIGATYYDRRLEVDQLYVRQSENELTINGELLWPKQRGDWTQLPFRGLLNATIPDLNSFSQLFGATTGDFTGAILAEGNLDLLAPEAHGGLTLHGKEVKFRGVTIDSLGAALQLKGREVTLENLEARHAEDFLRAEGNIGLAKPHPFGGRLTGAINDLGVYAPLLPENWRASKLAGGATFDWRGDGTLAAHSGTVQFFAHGLQLPVAPLRMPFDLSLEGSYSPQDVFFRTFQLGSDRVSLGGYLMIGSNFVELQALQFALDGVPRASGTVFLPFGLNRWRTSGSLLAAFAEEQKFDVDLAVDHLDLAALSEALGEKAATSGVLEGKLAAFGPLRSLQVTTSFRLENFGRPPRANTIGLHLSYSDGRADVDATATFGVSSPLTMRTSLPLRLKKDRLAVGTVVDRAAPFSFGLECPALFLDTLPNDWRYGAEDGFVSGAIYFSGNLSAPEVSGTAQILDASFKPPPLWPPLDNLTAQIRFEKTAAVIEPLRCEVDGATVALGGRLTTSPSEFRLTLTSSESGLALVETPPSGADLAGVRLAGSGAPNDLPLVREAVLRGRIGSPRLSLTIRSNPESSSTLPQQTTYFMRPRSTAGETLLLRALPPPSPRLSLGKDQ